MSLVLSGPVLGVIERTGEKDGKKWSLRNCFVQHGLGSLPVTLADEIPSPGEGEIVAFEVRARAKVKDDGTPVIFWSAVKQVELPALSKAGA